MTTFFNSSRFNILLVIDGSEESSRGLRYAERVGRGNDADITLLYVRPVDKSRAMAGLDMRTVRQNMLEWGLELPGMSALEKTREMLLDSGYMSKDWAEEAAHREVTGDPLGDRFVNYTSESGARITLKLIVRRSLAHGILDETERYDYDLTILALSGKEGGTGRDAINWPVTQRVLHDYQGTVLVARGIEENHGHLICVTDDERSVIAAQKDAVMASRCNCPVYLLSVASSQADVPKAEHAIAMAQTAISRVGIQIEEAKVRVGDPKDMIIRQGKAFSVIVMAEPKMRGWRRMFKRSIAMGVMCDAHNSVMIIR